MSKEIPRNTIVDLSKDLIHIPSVTGNKEAMDKVLDRVKTELESFSVEEFVEPQSGTRSLLFFNTSNRPESFRILFNGHLDVVSANPEQFKPYVKEGKLFGRGASDMKAGAAVELLVFKYLARNLPYPIALQLVTDEETGGFNGTGFQVKKGVRADMVISGESTELNINNERKGVLVLEITTHGKSTHAAYPSRGDNAVTKIVKLMTQLNERFPIPEYEDKWVTTLNIAAINTPNREHNKVPDIAHALLDFRHVPTDTKKVLLQIIGGIAPPGTEVTIDKQGFELYANPNHPDIALLAQSISAVTNKQAQFIRKAGSSDSRHFAEFGSVAIDFGPKGYGVHSDLEWGDIESYEQYADILIHFLTSIK